MKNIDISQVPGKTDGEKFQKSVRLELFRNSFAPENYDYGKKFNGFNQFVVANFKKAQLQISDNTEVS